MRKYKTSTAAKNRYNRKAYDQLNIRIKKGSLQEVNNLARERGLSTAAYIKSLIIADASERNHDISSLLGGGE